MLLETSCNRIIRSNPKALIASKLEPDLIDLIRQDVPEVEDVYPRELLDIPRYTSDHMVPPDRAPEQERLWRTLLAEAEILFDFNSSHLADLPELAPNLKWIRATSAGIDQYVKPMGYAERTDWLLGLLSVVETLLHESFKSCS